MLSKKFLIIFGVLIFYIVLIAFADFDKFSKNISQFKFEYLPIILGISFVVMMIKGSRQQILLRKIKVDIPYKSSILLYMAGMSMIVTPGGSGELIKSYFLKKKFGYKVSKTLPIVLVERMHDLMAVVTIISITLFFHQNYSVIVIITIVIVALIIGYMALRNRKIFELLTNLIKKIPRMNKQIENITESYDVFHSLTPKKFMTKNWLISLFAWGLDALAVYLVFVGFNLNFEIFYTTFVMYSSLLFGVITLMPAGLGVTELSAVGLLMEEGISLSLATSIIIMFRIVSIWYATIVGFITTRLFLSK